MCSPLDQCSERSGWSYKTVFTIKDVSKPSIVFQYSNASNSGLEAIDVFGTGPSGFILSFTQSNFHIYVGVY